MLGKQPREALLDKSWPQPLWPRDCKSIHTPGSITPAVTRLRYNFSDAETGSEQLDLAENQSSSVAALLPGPGVGVPAANIAHIQQDCGLPLKPLAKFVGINAAKECGPGKPHDDGCQESNLDAQILATNAVRTVVAF